MKFTLKFGNIKFEIIAWNVDIKIWYKITVRSPQIDITATLSCQIDNHYGRYWHEHTTATYV